MAYGQPLQPNRTKFNIGIYDGEITIFVTDLEAEDNDDVRDVVHPDFDRYWGNAMENVFTTDHFKTMKEAKEWCISIGMEFDEIAPESEIKDENKVVSPEDKYTIQDLKYQLAVYEREENYEKCAQINAEIKRRESEAVTNKK